MTSGDEPQLGGGQPKKDSTNEPSLPLKTLKFPLRTHFFDWVMTPEDAESEPQFIPGHHYTMGFSRTEQRGYLAIVDASVHLLVAYHTLGQGLGGQIERTVEIVQNWERCFVVVDAANGGQYLAEAIRSRGVSAMRDTPDVGQDLYSLMAGLQDARLAVYPDPFLFMALRSADIAIDNKTGKLRFMGLTSDESSLLIAVALAWRAANQPRLLFGMRPSI